MRPEKIFYEPPVLNYELGRHLREKYAGIPWTPIENHNNIETLRRNPNHEFVHMKHYLILGIRKSMKYTPNHKVSDFLVLIPHPAAVPSVFTAIWSAITTNARISGSLSTASKCWQN